MEIGHRLRMLREEKNLSQGDIEKKTGLLRCYISRVENGHTVPAIETLEKIARALDLPLYRLFYTGDKPPEIRKSLKLSREDLFSRGKGATYLSKLCRTLSQASDADRALLMHMARKVAPGR